MKPQDSADAEAAADGTQLSGILAGDPNAHSRAMQRVPQLNIHWHLGMSLEGKIKKKASAH